MLILSFSPISGDARVLKQVTRFTRDFDVTTCGYGPKPAGVVEHIEIPRDVAYDNRDGRLIVLRLHRLSYWRVPAVAWVQERLSNREFDVAIANDVEAVPVAVELRPGHGVVADLHEYSPQLHAEFPAWRRLITPWFNWIVRTYVARADAWSTVSQGLVNEYHRNFGFRPELVANAAPYQQAEPRPVESPIRLVHSGAGLENRQLHLMAQAVVDARADVTLDFYLTLNSPAYLERLREFASEHPRIRVHDPVPYADLPAVLQQYDVGIFVLPPVNFNYEHSLPNKLFDFVQARLGMIVGPSPEMAAFVTERALGEVTEGFDVVSIRAAIERLTPESVRRFKAAADDQAADLSGERQTEIWAGMIDRMMCEPRSATQ